MQGPQVWATLGPLTAWRLGPRARAPSPHRITLYAPALLRDMLSRLEAVEQAARRGQPPPLWLRDTLLLQHAVQPHLSPAPPPLTAAPPPPPPPLPAGVVAARGWAVAALLLALLVLLARLSDKCFHLTLFGLRRRRAQGTEWPTSTVIATTNIHNEDASLEGIDPFNSEPDQETGNDLPPPYSACSNAESNVGANKPLMDEPPPPYSACYVAFSNPKDGTPSVHFLNSQRKQIFNSDDSGSSAVRHTNGTIYDGEARSTNNDEYVEFREVADNSNEALLSDSKNNSIPNAYSADCYEVSNETHRVDNNVFRNENVTDATSNTIREEVTVVGRSMTSHSATMPA